MSPLHACSPPLRVNVTAPPECLFPPTAQHAYSTAPRMHFSFTDVNLSVFCTVRSLCRLHPVAFFFIIISGNPGPGPIARLTVRRTREDRKHKH